MREIFFRGRCYDDGEWIFGSLLDDDIIVTKGSVDVDESYIGINGNWSSVLVETVGQYTGSMDKNEVKIFEGDIVADESGEIAPVVFEDGSFFADYEGYEPQFLGEWCEVVGNIFENKINS